MFGKIIEIFIIIVFIFFIISPQLIVYRSVNNIKNEMYSKGSKTDIKLYSINE